MLISVISTQMSDGGLDIGKLQKNIITLLIDVYISAKYLRDKDMNYAAECRCRVVRILLLFLNVQQ